MKSLKINDKRDYYRNHYLLSDHWRKLRAQKLAKNPVCEICGYPRNLEPHHIVYKNLYDVTTDDLQTLCRRCHTSAHIIIDFNKAAVADFKMARKEKKKKRRLINKMKKLGIDKNIAKFTLDKLIQERKIKLH